MENHTAKHFALQLGSLASLYLSLAFLLVLVFAAINIAIPDATDSSWQLENYQSQVRLGFAMVLVFFPTYLILTRLVNTSRRQDPAGSYLGLTKWLIYLSLLVGGAVLLGDLVAVILAFLEGEVTERFILKALAVLLVIGTAMTYYLLDARGYWLHNQLHSQRFGLGATLVVLVCLIAGFSLIEGPGTARERALDQEQVRDLEMIQREIASYLAVTDELPSALSELTTPINLPTAPADRADYTYTRTDDGFRLCATFATASRPDQSLRNRPLDPSNSSRPMIINPDEWSHEAGEVCFERFVRGLASTSIDATPGE